MDDFLTGQAARRQSRLLPACHTAKEFGKVYVRRDGGRLHVEFTVWVPELGGAAAEGWRTGVALDASAGMKDWYGRNLVGAVPDAVAADYEARGWVRFATHDGRRVRTFRPEAYEDAIANGHVRFTENVVQPLARKLIEYLAGQFDSEGSTAVLYCSCGPDGTGTEVVGDTPAAAAKALKVAGPLTTSFGAETRLTPALRYFAELFAESPRGLYVFLTDGRLDDLDDLKAYTAELAGAVSGGRRPPLKCVLVGVGTEVDDKQLAELDDFDTGTGVDLWDHKVAASLRGVHEVIVELVDGSKVVAPRGVVHDASGEVLARYPDGLRARAAFTMPADSEYFELEVAGRRVRQYVNV